MKKISITLMLLCFIVIGFSQVLFYETFDNIPGPTSGGPGTFTFPPAWTLVDVDSLTPESSVAFVTDAWIRREDFNETITDTAAFSNSWYVPAGRADDWMWTPPISIPNSPNGRLSWRAVVYDVDSPDGYQVRIMVDPNVPNGSRGNLGNMVDSSTVLFSVPAENAVWTPHTVSLAAYANKTVRIAYRNNSFDDYLLLIDDVKVDVLSPDDVGVEGIQQYPDEYVKTPSSQIHAFSNLGATIKNYGTTNVSGVYLQMEVYRDGVRVSSTNSNPVGSLTPGSSTNVIVPQAYTPTGDGVYLIKYVAKFQGTDLNHANDTSASSTISIADSTYARDNDQVVGSVGVGALTGDGVYASYFEIHENTLLTSVSYYLTEGGTYNDNRTRLKIFGYDRFTDLPGELLYTSPDYSYNATDSANGVLVTMSVYPPIQVAAGRKIYVGVEEHGASTMTLGAAFGSFTPNTSRKYWGTNTSWDAIENFGAGYQRALFIRPNFGSTDCPFITSNSTAVTCSGLGSAELTVSAGVSPYSFNWSNGSDSTSIQNVAAGYYRYTVTAGTCVRTDSVSIADDTYALNVSGTTINASTANATDGAINVSVSGGVPPYITSPSDLTALSPGQYIVTVTDSNLCTKTDTFTVSFANTIAQLSPLSSWQVYPNPFSETLQFSFLGVATNTQYTLEIVDALGRIVYADKIVASGFSIETSNWQSGVYSLRLTAVGETITRKLVLQR